MIVAAVVVGLFVLSTAAYLAGVWASPKWIVQVRRRRVLIHMVDDRTIEGVLLETDGESVVLTDAKYLDRNGSTAMAGDVWILRSRVRFLQTIPSEAG